MGIYNNNASIDNIDGKFVGNTINAGYLALGTSELNENTSNVKLTNNGNLTNGGRNGVVLSAGFRWTIGKNY